MRRFAGMNLLLAAITATACALAFSLDDTFEFLGTKLSAWMIALAFLAGIPAVVNTYIVAPIRWFRKRKTILDIIQIPSSDIKIIATWKRGAPVAVDQICQVLFREQGLKYFQIVPRTDVTLGSTNLTHTFLVSANPYPSDKILGVALYAGKWQHSKEFPKSQRSDWLNLKKWQFQSWLLRRREKNLPKV